MNLLFEEGSGRVNTYLSHKLIHSYTIECNYNTSRVANEISMTDGDPGGHCTLPATPFSTTPDKYTPSIYAVIIPSKIMIPTLIGKYFDIIF